MSYFFLSSWCTNYATTTYELLFTGMAGNHFTLWSSKAHMMYINTIERNAERRRNNLPTHCRWKTRLIRLHSNAISEVPTSKKCQQTLKTITNKLWLHFGPTFITMLLKKTLHGHWPKEELLWHMTSQANINTHDERTTWRWQLSNRNFCKANVFSFALNCSKYLSVFYTNTDNQFI